MLNRAIILSQADFKYSLIMLIVLFVNILLCGYTLIFFTYSSIAILVNILYLITSIVLIINIDGNQYLTSSFHSLNAVQLYLCWNFYGIEDINLQIQKIVLLLSIMILNFCKIEYDRQNILIKDYQEIMMIIESDNDSDDDSDENYEDEKKTLSV
jgi:hypothetical protein